MKPPVLPDGEPERLAALHRYDILDTTAEPCFDALAELAAHTLGTSVALVSLVDTDRQWFKARYGLSVAQTPRQVSFCGHVVAEGVPIVVEDTHLDERFVDNPLVTGEPKIRFYAGSPLRTPDGFVLGTLCAIDRAPKHLDSAQLRMLHLLAQQVVDQLEARRQRRLILQDRARLAESERRLSALFHSMAEGAVLQNRDGAIMASNGAAARILGLSVEQMEGRTSIDPRWRAIYPDGSPFPGESHPAMISLKTARPQRGVVMGVHKPDSELTWIEINTEPLFDDLSGVPYAVAATFHDITALKAAQEEREKLARQERLVTTGTLAAGVGHEINNPLAYVSANIELALEELHGIGGASPSGRIRSVIDALTDARGGAEKIRRIVRGLRAFAREDGQIGPTSVPEAVDVSIHMAMHELRHKASIVTDVRDVPPVLADESRLSQVLVNLLVNAGQAFETHEPTTNLVHLRAAVQDNKVLFTVQDNGPGIKTEIQHRIFDPFFTTKPLGQGTGLGLAICHSIVSSLGGEISCRSAPGAGAVFEFTLPLASEPAAATPEPPLEAHPRCRVLLVDDDPAVLRALTRGLQGDYDVVAIEDPRLALELISRSEPFAAIFCDLMMPHIGGVELYERLLQRDPSQAERFVFVTGGVQDPHSAKRLTQIGGEHLEKPFSIRQLREIAQRITNKSQRSSGKADLRAVLSPRGRERS